MGVNLDGLVDRHDVFVCLCVLGEAGRFLSSPPLLLFPASDRIVTC